MCFYQHLCNYSMNKECRNACKCNLQNSVNLIEAWNIPTHRIRIWTSGLITLQPFCKKCGLKKNVLKNFILHFIYTLQCLSLLLTFWDLKMVFFLMQLVHFTLKCTNLELWIKIVSSLFLSLSLSHTHTQNHSHSLGCLQLLSE